MKSYFATQIYQKKIPFDLPDLRAEIELIRKSDHAGLIWSELNYPMGYTSYGSLDQLHRLSSTFEKLQIKLDHHVAQFLKQLQYQATVKKDLGMTDCWVNIMPPGAQHTVHLHPRSVISGTFYVSVARDSSAIQFEDPRLGLFMNSPALKSAAKTVQSRFVSLQPQAGDVVLFESWLKHGVPVNKSKSKTPRVSISFNYGWK